MNKSPKHKQQPVPKAQDQDEPSTTESHEEESKAETQDRLSKMKDYWGLAFTILSILSVIWTACWTTFVYAYQNWYVPAHEKPSIEQSCSLQQIGVFNGRIILRETTTITNQNTYRLWILGQCWNLAGENLTPNSPAAIIGNSYLQKLATIHLLGSAYDPTSNVQMLLPHTSKSMSLLISVPLKKRVDIALIQVVTIVCPTKNGVVVHIKKDMGHEGELYPEYVIYKDQGWTELPQKLSKDQEEYLDEINLLTEQDIYSIPLTYPASKPWQAPKT